MIWLRKNSIGGGKGGGEHRNPDSHSSQGGGRHCLFLGKGEKGRRGGKQIFPYVTMEEGKKRPFNVHKGRPLLQRSPIRKEKSQRERNFTSRRRGGGPFQKNFESFLRATGERRGEKVLLPFVFAPSGGKKRRKRDALLLL